jgi:hypothetical protein
MSPDWRTHEPIPTHLGGGAIVKGPLGCLHLVGAAWSWWQCPTCEAAKRNARRADEVRDLITEEKE